MDFKLILLLVGLGLLAIVILFALWGFLGGLKRELKCIAVFFILLLLAWLIFGNSGILMNYDGSLVQSLQEMLKLPTKDATLWETIVDYLKSIEGLNGEALLVEGKETYNLVFNIVSGLATMILLIVATLAVVIITPIIRLISHIVGLIINSVKKKKAAKLAAEKVEEDPTETVPEEKPDVDDAVLVLEGLEGADDVVVTTDENKLPEPKKTKKRVWGAIAGALKGVFLIILLFAPISGIYAVIKTATPETRELISDLVEGDTEKQQLAEESSVVDMVFDFSDAYGNSAVGKFVESSSYFFGQSFSTLIFDSSAKVKTDAQTIYLREELVTFLEAANALNGKFELGSWTDAEVANALEALKDSKILVELMPALIEFAYEQPTLKEALANATQEAGFLKLRDINWDQDLEKILDAVKVAYKLDLFPLEDFNYLTMDPVILQQITNIIGETEFIKGLLPVVVRTGIKLEAVAKITGPIAQKLLIDDINWKEELASVVAVYALFQEYGYTEMEELQRDIKVIVEEILTGHFDTTVSIFDELVEMAIFSQVVIPVGQRALDYTLTKEGSEYQDFANIINLNALTEADWKEDFKSILEAAKLAVSEMDALTLDLKEMDIQSQRAIEAAKQIIEKVLSLNVLGDDDTKNSLILAIVTKFDLLNEEDLYVTIDGTGEKVSIFENINWTTIGENIGEIETLKNLLDVYAKFVSLDEVDMKELTFEWLAMLDNDDAIDVLVSALEELVDSELVVSALSPVVNKYVLPITDKYDDDNLVKDIIANVGSETAAREIINIVEAFKSASELGLFKVANDGLSALNYANTEAMENIINTIFDSKLFVGYEGRIIRIILKATKILDVEKGLLNDINYSAVVDKNGVVIKQGERDLLISFINTLEPILKDPDFKLTDSKGDVQFDMDYFTQPEVSKQLMAGLQIILGTFEIDEEGNLIEKDGSKLIEALLPNIYATYLKKLIPDEFAELAEILKIEDLTGKQLVSDLKRLVFAANELIQMDVQQLLVGGSVNYVNNLEHLYNIIDVISEIEMLKPCGNEVYAWVINYASDKLATSLGVTIEKVKAEDFAHIDWESEINIEKELIKDIVEFLEVNGLNTTEDLTSFFKNGDYASTNFVTDSNATKLLNILEKMTKLQTLDPLLPVIFQAGVNYLVKQNIIEDFWNGQLTGSELKEDINNISKLAKILINDVNIVYYWQSNFEKGVPLPHRDVTDKILDILFGLNVMEGYETPIAKFFANKLIPTNNYINGDALFTSHIVWQSEKEAIKDLVAVVLKALKGNQLDDVNDIKDLISDKDVDYKDYITNANIGYLSELLAVAQQSQLITNALPGAFDELIKMAIDNGYDISFMTFMDKASLTEDLGTLSELAYKLSKDNAAPQIKDLLNDINSYEINTGTIKLIVEYISKLNVVTAHENELMSLLINKGFEAAKLNDFTLTADDLANVNWESDFSNVQKLIDVFDEFMKVNDLVTVNDINDYFKATNVAIEYYITNENAQLVADALMVLADMGVVKALLPKAVTYAIKAAEDKGYDISFLENISLTTDELASDIINIAGIVIDAIKIGAIELYKGETVNAIDPAIASDIIAKLTSLNIINKYGADWMAFITNTAIKELNKAIKDLNYPAVYEAADFANITDEQRNQDAVIAQDVIADLAKLANQMFASGISIEKVKEAFGNKEILTDDSIINSENVALLSQALGKAFATEYTSVIAPDMVQFGIDKAVEKGYDISFLDAANVAETLSSDIPVIGEIASGAIEFGLLDLYNKRIFTIKPAVAAEMVAQLGNLQVLSKYAADWMAFATNLGIKELNKAIKGLNYTAVYDAEDFAGITADEWVADTKALEIAVSDLLTLFKSLLPTGVTSGKITEFFKDAKNNLLNEDALSDENVDLLTDALSNVLAMNSFGVLLPDMIRYGLDKAVDKGYEVSFLQPKVVAKLLSNDIVVIGNIVKDLVKLGALDIYNKVEVASFDTALVEDIATQLANLQTLATYAPNWMAFAANLGIETLNKAVPSLNYNYGYTEIDFKYVTPENWAQDTELLKDVLTDAVTLITNLIPDGITIDKVNEFFKNKDNLLNTETLSDANIDLVTDALSKLFAMNTFSVLVPDMVQYGVDKAIAKGFEIGFVKDVATSQVLSSDILAIGEIAKEAIKFGAIEYLNTKDIAKVNPEYLANIVANLHEVQTFTLARGEWLAFATNKLLSTLKINYTVSADIFEGITEEEWAADNANLQSILRNNLVAVLDELQLDSFTEIKQFIADKGYMMEQNLTPAVVKLVTALVSAIADFKAVQPLLPEIFIAASKTVKAVDLSFIVRPIELEDLTGDMLAQDIKTICSIIDDAVDFGALDIFFKRLETVDPEIELSYVSSILAKLDTINFLAAAPTEWVNLGFKAALKAAKIDWNFFAGDFAFIKGDEWHEDSVNAIAVVDQIAELLDNLGISKYSEAKQFITEKGYLSAQYITDENVKQIADIIESISKIQVVQPLYAGLIKYGIEKVGDKIPNVDFFVEKLTSHKYEGADFSADLALVAGMIRDAVDFGAIQLFYEQRLDNINLTYVESIFDKATQLHVFAADRRNWTTLVLNKVFELAKINITVTDADFAHMNEVARASDIITVKEIIKQLAVLLADNNIESTDDVLKVINEKLYTTAQYANETNVLTLSKIVDLIGSLQFEQNILDDLAIYGIDKLNDKIDLSFMKPYLENGTLTGADIASDLRTLSVVINDVVAFGALEYYFYQSIDEIRLDLLADAISQGNNIHIYQVAKQEWFVRILNKALSIANIDGKVENSDFAGIDLEKEVDLTVALINKLDELLTSLNLVSTNDIKEFIEAKNYLNGTYVNELNINIVANVVDIASQMATVYLLAPSLAKWGVNKLQVPELQFLKDAFNNNMFTSDELISDLKNLVYPADIATGEEGGLIRIAAKFGLFDALFDIAIEDMKPELLGKMVAKLEDLHLFTELRPEWLSLALNKALASTGISCTPADFSGITEANYLSDNIKLQAAVVALGEILKNEDLTYKTAILDFIKNKDYMNTSLYTDENVNLLTTALTNLVSTHTVNVIYTQLLNKVIKFAGDKGYDISFLSTYISERFINDIPTLLTIAQDLVAFGLLEFIKDKEIANIDVSHLVHAVEKLEEISLFNKYRANWIALGMNKALEIAKVSMNVNASTFDSITEAEWKADNQNLQALLNKVGEILNNNNLISYSDVKEFIAEDKMLIKESTYTDANLTLFADAAKILCSLNIADAVFPQVLSKAVAVANNKAKLDIAFLEGKITLDTLKNDIDTVVKMFKSAVKFGLFDYIETKELHFLNLIYLIPIVDELENLGTFTVDRAGWTAAIVNCISLNAKLGINVTASTFDGLDWQLENDLFQKFLLSADTFLVESDLVLVSNLKSFINSGLRPQKQFVTDEMANLLLDAVDAGVDLQTVQAMIKNIADFGLTKVAEKGLDYKYLLADVTDAELAADVKSIVSALRDLVDFGLIGFMYREEALDYSKDAHLYAALDKLFALNIFVGHESDVLVTALKKYNVDTTALEAEDLDFAVECAALKVVLDNAFVALENFGFDTFAELKSIDFKSIKWFDANFNENIEALSNILDALATDETFKLAGLQIYARFIEPKVAKYAGIADLNNIYSNVYELLGDMQNISLALDAIHALDVYGFMNGDINYPYTDIQHVEIVIDKLLNLTYFNKPGRMEAILKGLSSAVPSLGLTNIDGNAIDLAGDSVKLIEMYKYLANVLGDSDFPFQNKADWSTKKVSLSFFLGSWIFQNEINAIKEYMSTTIYDQTGPAILVLLLPIVKKVLPKYYNALDLDNYGIDKATHDTPYIMAIIDEIMALDPIAINSGKLSFDSLADSIDKIIDNAVELQLLENHIGDLVALILEDNVYGKQLGKYNIPAGTFDLEGVDFESDAAALKLIARDAIIIMKEEGVNNLEDAKAYVKSFKPLELLDSQYVNNALDEIISKVASLTIVRKNLKALYMTFAVPVLEDKKLLEYVDYRSATNEEMVADLDLASEIFGNAVLGGLGFILKGDDINYDQADIVRDILTALSKTNYIKYHANTYINKLKSKITGFDAYAVSAEDLDIAGDLIKFADVYEQLVPMLDDYSNPFKDKSKFTGFNFATIKNWAYEFAPEISNAYAEFVKTSVAPYFVYTGVNAIKNLVSDKFKPVAECISLEYYNIKDLRDDTAQSAKVLAALVELNIFEYLANKSAPLPSAAEQAAFVNELYEVKFINKKLTNIVMAICDIYSIDTSLVELYNLDWESDKNIGVALLPEINEILKELDVTTYEGAKQLINDFRKSTNLLSTAKTYLKKLGVSGAQHVINVSRGMLDLSVVKQLALPFAKKALTKVNLPTKLADLQPILALAKYDSNTFINDIKVVLDLGSILLESELYKSYKTENRNQPIDWASPYFDQLIRKAVELEFIGYYANEIVKVAGNLVKFDLSTFKIEKVDYKNEADYYVNVYHALTQLLTDSSFPYATAQQLVNLVKAPSSLNWRYFIQYVPAKYLVAAAEELNGTTLSAELARTGLTAIAAKKAFPGSKYFDPRHLNAAELTADYVTLMNIANAALDFIYNNGAFVRVGKDSSLENVAAAQMIINELANLNLFKGKYAEIISSAFANKNVDNTNVDLSLVDWNAEFGYLREMATEVLLAMNEYGITSFKELKPELQSFLNTFKASKKEFLKKVKNALVSIDVEHIVLFVEAFDKSLVADQVLIPLYNRFLINRLPANYRAYADLSGYTNADLAGDTHLAAEALRAIYNSEVYKVYTEKMTLSDSAIPYLQEAILAISNMKIVDMKKQDVVNLANEVTQSKYKLYQVNVSGVDVVADGAILAGLVPAIYDIYLYSNSFRFRIDMMGKTMLMENFISTYETLLTTDTIKAVLPWAVRTFAVPRVQSIVGTNRLNDMNDARVMNIANDMVTALYAMLEIGVFGNAGIDLTKTAETDKMFAVLYNNFNLGKYRTYVEFLQARLPEYGVLPVDYSVLNTKDEVTAFKELVKALKEFVNNYKSVIGARDIAAIASAAMQADITNLFNKALASKLISQVFMPVMSGSVRALTSSSKVQNKLGISTFSLFDGMTNDQFINVALPDLFQMVTYANSLGAFAKTGFKYKDTDTIMALVDLVVTSEVTKNACYDLFPAAIKKLLGITVTKQELLDKGVNFVDEAKLLDNFFNDIKSELNKPSVSIKDPDTLLTQSFLLALSDAGLEMKDSTVLAIVIKPLMKKLLTKISSSNNTFDFMLDELDKDTYTDAMALQDYVTLLEVIKQAALLNFFGGAGLDYANLNPELPALVTALFALNAFNGNEAKVMDMMFSKISFIDATTIDYTGINWTTEKPALINMITELGDLCATPGFNINSVTADMFKDATIQTAFVNFVDAISQSEIGRQILPKMYNDKVVANLGTDYADVIDFNTLTPTDWDNEFQKLFNLYSDLDAVGFNDGSYTGTFNDTLAIFDQLFGTEADPNSGIASVAANRKVWLDKLLDSVTFPAPATGFNMNRSAITEANATAETWAIRNVIKAMSGFVADPATATIGTFDYNAVKDCQDYAKLEAMLVAISKAESMKTLIVGIVGDGVVSNSSSTGTFNVADLLSDAFMNQYNNKTYDDAYWTADEFSLLSKLIATCNAIDFANNSDIFGLELGTAFPNVSVYNIPGGTTIGPNYPSQTSGANNVGLRQVLQLMNYSSTFDASQLGGDTGIIAGYIAGRGTATFTKQLGVPTDTVAGWDEEIIAVTSAMKVMKDSGLLDSGVDMASLLASKTDSEIKTILGSLNESEIIRPMLPEVVFESLAVAVDNGSTLIDLDSARTLVGTAYPWLKNQQAASAPVAPKAEWTAEIAKIAEIIATGDLSKL